MLMQKNPEREIKEPLKKRKTLLDLGLDLVPTVLITIENAWFEPNGQSIAYQAQ